MKIERGPHGIIGVIKIDNPNSLVSYELEILESRQIPNLLPVFFRTIRENLELCYDITGLISVENLIQIEWTYVKKRTVLLSALITVFSCENYYLSPEKFLFEANHIFINPTLEKPDFIWCYLPIEINRSNDYDYKTDIEKLLLNECLLPLLTEGERVQIIHFMQKTTTSELIDFLLILQEKKQENNEQQRKIHPFIILSGMYLLYLCSCLIKSQSGNNDFTNTNREFILASAILIYGIFIWRGKHNMNFLKRSKKIENQISKDILFPTEKNNPVNEIKWQPYFLLELKPTALNEFSRKAIILTDEFILGKDPIACDYTFEDKKIEDVHARIERNGDNFFITDMDSEHGTWLKNTRLEVSKKNRLENGDIIQIADTVLLFTDGKIEQEEGNI